MPGVNEQTKLTNSTRGSLYIFLSIHIYKSHEIYEYFQIVQELRIMIVLIQGLQM